VGISALAFFAYYYVVAVEQGFVRQSYPAMIAIILAGACAGFLFHNFHPARVFMGDTGSMLLGLLLAVLIATNLNEILKTDQAEALGAALGMHIRIADSPTTVHTAIAWRPGLRVLNELTLDRDVVPVAHHGQSLIQL
jgi:UDP-GlcNAc:undecaprenyl-phosphate GlcNAc-1-phosphate transferase